jgi:hypothetical protein
MLPISSKQTFGVTFYINRGKEKKNGECPVMMRININARLTQRLLDCGYISKQRIITPAQVKIIIEELGVP